MIDSITLEGISNANIQFNYSHPINLGVYNISTDVKGFFKFSNKIMKLLVYGVDV